MEIIRITLVPSEILHCLRSIVVVRVSGEALGAPVLRMAKSCKEIAQSLVDCMKNTPCMKGGGDLRTCLKPAGGAESESVNASSDRGDCQELRAAYFNCKRGGLDMRTRIRGQRVY